MFDWLTVSSDLLDVGGVRLSAVGGGEMLLIGAVLLGTMEMMRKAAAVSVTRGRLRRGRRRGEGGRWRSADGRRRP